jgi:hypothetical protein
MARSPAQPTRFLEIDNSADPEPSPTDRQAVGILSRENNGRGNSPETSPPRCARPPRASGISRENNGNARLGICEDFPSISVDNLGSGDYGLVSL